MQRSGHFSDKMSLASAGRFFGAANANLQRPETALSDPGIALQQTRVGDLHRRNSRRDVLGAMRSADPSRDCGARREFSRLLDQEIALHGAVPFKKAAVAWTAAFQTLRGLTTRLDRGMRHGLALEHGTVGRELV